MKKTLTPLAVLLVACGGGGNSPVSDAGATTDGSAVADSSAPNGPDAAPPVSYSCQATHYVRSDADGAGDGGMGSPWTLAQAMTEASPGNVIVVAPGVYTAASTGERYLPAWNPAQSGTQGAPIVFCAEFPAVYNESSRSELRNDAAAEGLDASPAFGTNGRSYVVWDGFYVNEANSPTHPDTGPVVVWDSEHVTIARSVIVGEAIPRDDNHNGIRLEAVRNVSVVNNRISGIRHSVQSSRNHAALMTYDSSYVTIEHNEIFDCDEGLYLKGEHEGDGYPQGAFAVRYNRITDVDIHGINMLGIYRIDDQISEVSHNLMVRSRIGLTVNSVGAGHPDSIEVHHNTVVDGELGVYVNATSTLNNVHMRQNLFSGVPVFSYEAFMESDLRTVIANGYSTNDNHAHMHSEWAWGQSLSDWQTFSGLDVDSSTGDPLFVDPGAGNYHLAAGSPALTAANGGTPVGVYITGDEVIGIEPAP